MIKLDEWESQFVWFSKGWVDKEYNKNGDLDLDNLLGNLWAHRCGQYSKDVDMRYVAQALISLTEKVIHDFSAAAFVGKLSPSPNKDVTYSYQSFNYKICWICLYNYLSLLKIFDSKKEDGSRETLIHLQPLNMELFTEVKKGGGR